MSTGPRIPDPFETHLTTRNLDQLHRLLQWAADCTAGRGSKGARPWGQILPSTAHDMIARRIAFLQGGVVREEDRRDLLKEIDALKRRVADLESRAG
jgi:hypothetical protein